MSNQVPVIKSPFIEDIKEINEKLNFDITKYDIKQEKLYAAFIPFYVEPKSMQLMVVLKREIQPGAFLRTGRKIGLSTLNVELPIENPISIEDAFKSLQLGVNIQNAIPLGSVMPMPKETDYAVEMVLVQIDPPSFLDEKRQIIKQEPGKFEVGAIPFDALLGAIHENFLQDLITRMMLSELYILAIEEANSQMQEQDSSNFSTASQNNNNLIGGGMNHPLSFYQNIINDKILKTSNINEEFLKQNTQKDFGAIYQNFTTP